MRAAGERSVDTVDEVGDFETIICLVGGWGQHAAYSHLEHAVVGLLMG
jgi:hypothetical protein